MAPPSIPKQKNNGRRHHATGAEARWAVQYRLPYIRAARHHATPPRLSPSDQPRKTISALCPCSQMRLGHTEGVGAEVPKSPEAQSGKGPPQGRKSFVSHKTS